MSTNGIFILMFSGDDFLCYKNLTASGAVLTFCKTGFGAGCRYCFVDYLGVTKSRNSRLCHENFVTNGAMLAFGFTNSGAGGRYCFVNHFGVTGGRNSFLRYQNFITGCAVFALGFTVVGTSRRNGSTSDFGMSKCRNTLSLHKNLETGCTVFAFGQTRRCASRSNGRINNLGVYMRSGSGFLKCVSIRSSFLRIGFHGSSFLRCIVRVIACGEYQRTHEQNQTHKQREFDCSFHNPFTFAFQPVGIYVHIIAHFL